MEEAKDNFANYKRGKVGVLATVSMAVSCTEKADWVLLFCFVLIFLSQLGIFSLPLAEAGDGRRKICYANHCSLLLGRCASKPLLLTHVPSVYAFHTMAVPVITVSFFPSQRGTDCPVVTLQEGNRDLPKVQSLPFSPLPNVYTFIVTFY